jgi:hypothetical protein
MFGRLILVAVLASAATPGAFAGPAPKTTEDCFTSVIDLQKKAAAKKLGDKDNAKIEDLLVSMEDKCEAKDFEGAASISNEILGVIGG